jgi:hypothetical protein
VPRCRSSNTLLMPNTKVLSHHGNRVNGTANFRRRAATHGEASFELGDKNRMAGSSYASHSQGWAYPICHTQYYPLGNNVQVIRNSWQWPDALPVCSFTAVCVLFRNEAIQDLRRVKAIDLSSPKWDVGSSSSHGFG